MKNTFWNVRHEKVKGNDLGILFKIISKNNKQIACDYLFLLLFKN